MDHKTQHHRTFIKPKELEGLPPGTKVSVNMLYFNIWYDNKINSCLVLSIEYNTLKNGFWFLLRLQCQILDLTIFFFSVGLVCAMLEWYSFVKSATRYCVSWVSGLCQYYIAYFWAILIGSIHMFYLLNYLRSGIMIYLSLCPQHLV